MARRIEIELTSSRSDGSWTWRAAGALKPRGMVDGSLLYEGAKAGDVVRADADFEVEGITIVAVLPPKEKKRAEPERLEVIGPPRDPNPGVTTSLTSRDARDAGDGPRGPRRSGDAAGRNGRSQAPRPGRGGFEQSGRPGPERTGRGDRPGGPAAGTGDNLPRTGHERPGRPAGVGGPSGGRPSGGGPGGGGRPSAGHPESGRGGPGGRQRGRWRGCPMAAAAPVAAAGGQGGAVDRILRRDRAAVAAPTRPADPAEQGEAMVVATRPRRVREPGATSDRPGLTEPRSAMRRRARPAPR